MNKLGRLFNRVVDFFSAGIGFASILIVVLGVLSKVGPIEGTGPPLFPPSWWMLIFFAILSLCMAKYIVMSADLEKEQGFNQRLQSEVDIFRLIQVEFEIRWLANLRVAGAFDESAQAWQSLTEEALRLGYSRDFLFVERALWREFTDEELNKWAETLAKNKERLLIKWSMASTVPSIPRIRPMA